MSEVLLELDSVHVNFPARKNWLGRVTEQVHALNGMDLRIHRGETLGVVGESGCGKSVLCKSIMKLMPKSARIKSGSISINGQDITGYREKDMQKLRGKVFSMIF